MKLYAWTNETGGVSYGRTIPDVPHIEVSSLPDAPQEQWSIVGNEIVVDTAKYTAALRLQRKQEIKEHALSLMTARVDWVDTEGEVKMLAKLWPFLNNPASDPDLAYLRDVYAFLLNRLNIANTANLATLEGYDVTQDNWPI